MANLILVGAMAAALPALNILFATQMRIPVAQIPVTNASASNVLVGFRKPVSRATNPRVLAITSPAPMPNTVGVPIQHDEELAAEHRAAMGVLTESSGMDAPAVPEERVSADTKPGPPARASLPASWGSVALNAAERIVLMSGDHDSDDRH
jgi:hypothetical protein